MRAFLLGLVLALVAVSPGRADVGQDRRKCVRAPSPQAEIAACTRLLKTWRTTKAIRADAYFNRGVAYDNLKQYRQAISDYDQAIRINPRHANAYNNRGNAYHGLKQYHRAIRDYDQAIRLNPRHAKAYYNRGLTYQHHLKSRRKAIADFRAAHKLQPWNSKYAAKVRSLGVEL